mmetsp:Transcript_71311/g.133385  ORF Transcript_71311/g.133385 Transcript_71311/m.133385 type:complete len:267 (-) Transcript_71311:155-955(-)
MPLKVEECNGDDVEETSFKFHFLPDAKFQCFDHPEFQTMFEKWGLLPDMATVAFRVEQQVTEDSMQRMLECFFRDREVVSVLHSATRLRVLSPDKVRVRWEKMETKETGVASLLKKFEDCGALTSSGHISGRFEEDWDGVPIVNLIREAVLMEESELYDAFTEKDRREFLFRVFSHVVFGGAINQYEDYVEDYVKATKAIYKDLLTVKQVETGDVQVVSQVAAIQSLGQGGGLYHKESPLNFCYVIYDPIMRHVRVWYFGYRPLFM